MEALRLNPTAANQLDDATVIRRVLAGEKELFEILMRRYNQMLYRVVRGYLNEHDMVQDAMQNAYLKAYDKLAQYQGTAAFSTWLIRIGINEALLSLKMQKRERRLYHHATGTEDEAIQQLPDKQMNAEKIIIREETQRILEHAIEGLPPKYRIVYMLKEVEGMSNQQLAESLQLSESNLKVRLHRAKALLKERLLKLSSDSKVFEFGQRRCDAVVQAVMSSL